MSLRQLEFSRQVERLQAYLDGLTQATGHADRGVPMENYTKGLILPIERKSVEPMAARLAPGNVRQMHQSLHHVVADATWSDDALLRQDRSQVLPAMTRKHALAAWIVDDTGFPKKGTHSVGVARQYCGQLGKQENCRVAVSVSLATEEASIPAAYRLYLSEVWANDKEGASKPVYRRRSASRPSRILRLGRSVLWSARMYRVAWCWPMPPTETIMAFAKGWCRWSFPMRLASSPRPRFGLRASCRYRLRQRAKWVVRHGYCRGTNCINR